MNKNLRTEDEINEQVKGLLTEDTGGIIEIALQNYNMISVLLGQITKDSLPLDPLLRSACLEALKWLNKERKENLYGRERKNS